MKVDREVGARPSFILLTAWSTLFSTACCFRPTTAVDAAAPVIDKDAIPGVVVVAGEHGGSVCTGTVLKAHAEDGKTVALVLTAKHCVQQVQGRLIVGPSLGRNRVYASPARVVVASPEVYGTVIGIVPAFSAVEWSEDFAILEVRSNVPLTPVPIYDGDPAEDVQRGTAAVLQSYFDPDTETRSRLVWPHEHRFFWSGRPYELGQNGHSGSPVLIDGRLAAMLVGYKSNSLACQLLTWSRRPGAYRFVSIKFVRERAAAAGIALD